MAPVSSEPTTIPPLRATNHRATIRPRNSGLTTTWVSDRVTIIEDSRPIPAGTSAISTTVRLGIVSIASEPHMMADATRSCEGRGAVVRLANHNDATRAPAPRSIVMTENKAEPPCRSLASIGSSTSSRNATNDESTTTTSIV